MYCMKNNTILLVYATLLVAALITPLSAFASSSNDDNSDEDSDVSCDLVTGNGWQSECGAKTHVTPDGREVACTGAQPPLPQVCVQS